MVSFFFSLSLCFSSPDSGEGEAAQLFPMEPFFNLARLFNFDLNIPGSGCLQFRASTAKRDPPTFASSAALVGGVARWDIPDI